MLDYGILLDLTYTGIKIDKDPLVLTPLPLLKPKKTLRNRRVTVLVQTLNEPPATSEAIEEVKRLFLVLKRDITSALESFSTLIGIERDDSEDEGSLVGYKQDSTEPK